MYGYIYLTTNLINDKKYIGQHKSPIFDEKYKGSGKYLCRAIKKYGWDNFICEIIEVCSSADELNEKEEYWIEFYNAVESTEYYNIARGGNNAEKTPEYRAALKASWTEERKEKLRTEFWTKERRLLESQRLKEHNPMDNPEIRKYMAQRTSEAKKGKSLPHTEEWNKHIGDALRGRKNGPLSDETKAKISAKKSGKNNPMYGKSATKGTKWYTNGIINVRRKECPIGFIPGVTKFESMGE